MPKIFYSNDSSWQGNALVSLQSATNPEMNLTDDDYGFFVMSGLDRGVNSGEAFLGRLSVISLVNGLMNAGIPGTDGRIHQIPRLEITSPSDVDSLADPSSIPIAWDTEWRRWDGEKYLNDYSSNFAESDDLIYAVKYSIDSGATWRYLQDDSTCFTGVRPDPSHECSSSDSYNWDVSNPGAFPEGSYVIRTEVFREDFALHYSYHQRQRTQRGDTGVSFIELMVVMFLFSIIGLMAYDMLVGTAQTNLYLEANNDLSEYGQRLVNEIKTEVLQSKRLISDTVQGLGYLAALEMTDAPAPIDSTALASMEVNGSFSPSLIGDAEHPFDQASVGNAMFFVQAERPYINDTDSVRIDLYRFLYYYLSKNSAREIAEQGNILELIRWESVVFADYNQLVQLDNFDDGGAIQLATLQALQVEDTTVGRPAVTVAWNPDEDANGAFFSFGGGSLSNLADSSYKIEKLDASLAITQLNAPRIGGDMIYSVAFNTSETFELGDTVPVFATADVTNDGFPHGFEVMMGGPTGGRRVLVRLVLAADSGSARLVSRENIVLINARDY